MSRTLAIIFQVDDATASNADIEELADRIVATQIDPDPPILTYAGSEVRHG